MCLYPGCWQCHSGQAGPGETHWESARGNRLPQEDPWRGLLIMCINSSHTYSMSMYYACQMGGVSYIVILDIFWDQGIKFFTLPDVKTYHAHLNSLSQMQWVQQTHLCTFTTDIKGQTELHTQTHVRVRWGPLLSFCLLCINFDLSEMLNWWYAEESMSAVVRVCMCVRGREGGREKECVHVNSC